MTQNNNTLTMKQALIIDLMMEGMVIEPSQGERLADSLLRITRAHLMDQARHPTARRAIAKMFNGN